MLSCLRSQDTGFSLPTYQNFLNLDYEDCVKPFLKGLYDGSSVERVSRYIAYLVAMDSKTKVKECPPLPGTDEPRYDIELMSKYLDHFAS